MRVLLNRGADFSIAMDGGDTALHFATQRNLAVTVDLVRAGADLEPRTTASYMSLRKSVARR